MPSAKSKVFLHALGLGTLAGMRTFSAPVVCSHILTHHRSKGIQDSPLRFMQSGTAANLFKILAVGELVFDKLPFMPNRIEPASLSARCLFGALTGASIYKSVDRNVAVGALVGTSAALISSFASFYLRKAIRNKTVLPDAAIALVEDSLVLTMGRRLTR